MSRRAWLGGEGCGRGRAGGHAPPVAQPGVARACGADPPASPNPRSVAPPPRPACRAALEGGSGVGPDGRPRPAVALLVTKAAIAVGVLVLTRRVALARMVVV